MLAQPDIRFRCKWKAINHTGRLQAFEFAQFRDQETSSPGQCPVGLLMSRTGAHPMLI